MANRQGKVMFKGNWLGHWTLIATCLFIIRPTVTNDVQATDSSLALSLIQVIRLRAPFQPWSDCHFVDISEYASTISHSLLPYLHKNSVTVSVLPPQSQLPTLPFKYSSKCIFVLVNVSDVVKTPDWFIQKIGTAVQHLIHFILLGHKHDLVDIKSAFLHPSVQALKYKTLIDLHTSTIWTHVNDADNGLVSSSPSSPLPPLPSELDLMRERPLKVASWKFVPLTDLNEQGRPVGGIAFGSILAVAEKYNISMGIELSVKSIQKSETGTWEGFMHDLTFGDTDVLSALIALEDRHEAVDFTTPAYTLETKFYVARPTVTIDWLALIYPFQPSLWLVIFLSYVAVIPVIYFDMVIIQGRKSAFVDKSYALYEAVSFPLASLLMESVRIPRNTKLISIFFLFYATVIGAYYTSDLIGYLTFPEPEEVPRTFHDLVAAKDFRVILAHIPGAAVGRYLNESTLPGVVQLRQRIERDKNFLNCIQTATFERKTVCMGFSVTMETLVAKNLTVKSSWSPLLTSNEVIFSSYVSIALRKHSKYYMFWNSIVGIMRDTGHISKWRLDAKKSVFHRSRAWMADQFANRTELSQNLTRALKSAEDSGVKPLSLENFILSFICLVTGLLCGQLVMYLEVLVSTFTTNRPDIWRSHHVYKKLDSLSKWFITCTIFNPGIEPADVI